LQGRAPAPLTFQGPTLENCAIAEFFADGVGGAFGLFTPGKGGIEQVADLGDIGFLHDMAEADADQAEGALVELFFEQWPGSAVDRLGGLGGVQQAGLSADGFEVGTFQFQADGAAGLFRGLGAISDFFGQAPQVAVQDIGI